MEILSTKRSMVLITTGIIAASIGAYLLTPNIIDTTNDSMAPFQFAIDILATLFYLFAAIYFLTGLNRFKSELKKAYILLSFGFIALGLSTVQLPIITLLDSEWWTNSGFIVLPYLFSVILIFAGVRKLTRLLTDDTVIGSWLIVGLMAATSALIFASFPYANESIPEMERRATIALTTITATFYLSSALGVLRVKQFLSKTYDSAMQWLYLALLTSGLSAAHYVPVLIFSPSNDHWYTRYSLVVIGIALSGFVTMSAGYAFSLVSSKRTYRNDTNVDSKKYTRTNPESALIDMVSFTASLASRPTEIDSLLNGFREVTSKLNPGEKLSKEDKAILITTYENIVDYLLQNEPIRAYTRAGIEDDIHELFGEKFQILLNKDNPVTRNTQE